MSGKHKHHNKRSKKTTKTTIIDGVQVIEDGNVTHFIPVKDDNEKPKTQLEYKSTWQKICDWWNDEDSVKPFVKVMDLADPTGERKKDPDDIDAGCDGKTGVVIGLKWTF